MKESEMFRANKILEANKKKLEKRSRLTDRIHNLTNDLKSGLINWKEFDGKLEAMVSKELQVRRDY